MRARAGIQEFLEEAKRRRKTIAQAAVRRTLDLNKELAAHARAEGSHAGSSSPRLPCPHRLQSAEAFCTT